MPASSTYCVDIYESCMHTRVYYYLYTCVFSPPTDSLRTDGSDYSVQGVLMRTVVLLNTDLLRIFRALKLHNKEKTRRVSNRYGRLSLITLKTFEDTHTPILAILLQNSVACTCPTHHRHMHAKNLRRRKKIPHASCHCRRHTILQQYIIILYVHMSHEKRAAYQV